MPWDVHTQADDVNRRAFNSRGDSVILEPAQALKNNVTILFAAESNISTVGVPVYKERQCKRFL
jgi:hypothetical protein